MSSVMGSTPEQGRDREQESQGKKGRCAEEI
jgi:hypothetical protein